MQTFALLKPNESSRSIYETCRIPFVTNNAMIHWIVTTFFHAGTVCSYKFISQHMKPLMTSRCCIRQNTQFPVSFRHYAQFGWQIFLPPSLRHRLHWNGSVWNWHEIGTDKLCVYTGPGRSGTDRIRYLVPNGSTYEGDPIWNRTVPVSNWSCVNRVDPYHSGSDPKWIWSYRIPCKRSLNLTQTTA